MTNVLGIVPEIIVTVVASAVLVADTFLSRERSRTAMAALTAAGLLAAIVASLASPAGEFFARFVVVDATTTFFRVTFLLLALFATAVAPGYLARRPVPPAEYYATLSFSTVGAMTIALSADLITLFIGIELMTIPVYVLAGMQRRDRFSNEAALKYFLLGAFSTALLLYGFAWLYGVSGSTEFKAIARSLAASGPASGPVVVALALTTVGLGFKAAVVPFHQWTPDAYEGAPTPATAFMSVGPKAAAFAAILRVLDQALGPLAVDWSAVLAVLAVVTMTGGNVVALVQRNTKRMLAYSSIAHTGYILAGVAAFAAGQSAAAGVLYYVLAYGIMNLGAFACLLYLDVEGTRGASLEELNGFATRAPVGALAFAVFLVSLTGIPPTIGFFAKVFVIQPALEAHLPWLAVAIAANAAVAAFYYLRVVVHMYMEEPDASAPRIVGAPLLSVTLGLGAAATVVLGILPNSVYAWALAAASPLLAR